MADKQDIIETALKRYKYVSEYWQKQWKREQEDLRFQVPEMQWTDQARQERLGQILANGIPTPARPTLSVSLLNQPLQLLRNQQRQAKLGINIHPASASATPETAEVFQGLYRSIEQASSANEARGWAYDRAAKCGRGFYFVAQDFEAKDFDPLTPGPEVYDQELRIERILDQSTVYLDPAAQKADFSDGNFAFMIAWLPIETFRELYPDAKVPDAKAEPFAFEAMKTATPEWVKTDGAGHAILVANYWYKVHTRKTFVELGDGEVAIKENLPEGVEIPKRARERPFLESHLMFCKLAPGGGKGGLQHLEGPEEQPWELIPIIPVIGEELQPFDEERRFQGMITPNKDAQRFQNYACSTFVERMSLEPKVPFIGAEGQFEGHEAAWQQANTRNMAYLEYKAAAINGTPLPPPQRAVVDTTGASLAVIGLQTAREWLQSGTFAYDPSLGRQESQKSGKAILAEQQQFESSSSGYLYNLADISMNYEARVILERMPVIYDRPGRIARILDEEEKSEHIMLNAPFVTDPNTGQPMPANENQAGVKEYNLAEGRYAVTVTVGKSHQSARQEGGQVIGEIIQSHPEWAAVFGPLWAQMQDFPKVKEFIDLMLKLREMQFPGMASDEKQTPEQLTAQNYALKQQMQQAQQQIQMMQQALETKHVEQQGQLQKAQLDNETKVRTAQMDNETRVIIAAMQAELDQIKEALRGKQEKEAIILKTQGEIEKTAVQSTIPQYKGSADKPLPSEKGF